MLCLSHVLRFALSPLSLGLRVSFCKVGTGWLGVPGRDLSGPRHLSAVRQEHRELSLLENCEALLEPGLGFARKHPAKQASLPLKTMYEAPQGQPGPSHSTCLLRADTRAKNKNTGLGTSGPGFESCLL